MTEIELSVPTRQCLERRIKSADELLKKLEPWSVDRGDRAVA